MKRMSMVHEIANPEEYEVADLRPRFTEHPLHDGLLFVEREGDGAELFARVKNGRITEYVLLHPDGSQEEAIVQKRIQRQGSLDGRELALAVPLPVVGACYFCRQRGDTINCKRIPCPPGLE